MRRLLSDSFRLSILACLLLGACATTGGMGGARTEPGRYENWNDEIDRVEVVETFSTASYSRLVVGPLDTSETPLPDQDDNTYEPVQDVLRDVVTPLIEGIREAELAGIAIESASSTAVEGEGTLIFRGTVVDMDPGSRAARYWAGFGAGAARTTIDGELVDAASGRVLLRFTQVRVSGVGFGGGNYHNLMRRNLQAIGEDVGEALHVFR